MRNTLSMQMFYPRETLRDPDLLVVMPNEVATTLDDYHGARAQDVADTTGYHVLAYERQCSGADQRYSPRQRRIITDNSASVFSNTAAQLDKAIEREGPTSLYIAGHSAATTDVVGIPYAEHTKFDGIIATDPSSFLEAKRFGELTSYIKYQLFVERKKPELAEAEQFENTQPLEKPKARQMLARTIGELIVYGGYGSSTEPFKLLTKLVAKQKQLSVAVVYPEHTFTSDRAQQLEIKAMLESLRVESDAPIDVDLLDNTYHSTLDNYKLFAGIVLEKILDSESRK